MATTITSTAAAARDLWDSGDYTLVGTRLTAIAEELCETAGVTAGLRVLDVATGHGNTALAAARRDAEVVGIDIAPSLVVRAAERARVEGLDISFREGNAEAIDEPTDAFDIVTSSLGVQFAGDQASTAAELLRVVRPGGRIALACWSPNGFYAELPTLVWEYAPAPPSAPSPMTWGTEDGLRSLLGRSVALVVHPRTFRLRFRSIDRYLELVLPTFPPFVQLGRRVDPRPHAEFVARLAELLDRWNEADDGTLVLPMTYVVALADLPTS
jgi:ubiquinone/menaquinone biosynthesis C-methylase UbiE